MQVEFLGLQVEFFAVQIEFFGRRPEFFAVRMEFFGRRVEFFAVRIGFFGPAVEVSRSELSNRAQRLVLNLCNRRNLWIILISSKGRRYD